MNDTYHICNYFDIRNCDKCKKQLSCGNDRNGVSLNNSHYTYCERCYQDLFGLWEIWKSGNYKITYVSEEK